METFPKATTYRPLIHITPKKGWINDPNGFVFFKNEYHIYTQYNPYDTKWGPMHWLHFKSKDLINWEECGVVLKPDKPYDKEFGCFSGSIVVNDNKMFVYYTGATEGRQVQCLAISEDGEHFKKYKDNPILSENDLPKGYQIRDFRDPKVIQRNGVYYMLVVARHEKGYSSILLYSSLDLYYFEYKGVIKSFDGLEYDGMVECPDIIIKDDKCALIYSLQNRKIEDDPVNFSIWYQVGYLDLEQSMFVPQGKERKLDEGFDAYASQTIQLGEKTYITYWESIWGINYPTSVEGYVGQLSLFKEVKLDGDRLRMKFLKGTPTKVIEGKLTGDIGKIQINNIELLFNKKDSTIELSRRKAKVEIVKESGEVLDHKVIHQELPNEIKVEISYDHTCVEISINDGLVFASLLNVGHNDSNIVIHTDNIDLIQ